jgi:hypothetical protein
VRLANPPARRCPGSRHSDRSDTPEASAAHVWSDTP